MVISTRDTVLHLPEDRRIRVADTGWKVPMKVREVNGEAVLVEVLGALQVAGATNIDTLAVEVCEPGPLGDRFYVGNGDTLALRSAISGGRMKTAGEVRLRVLPHSRDVPFEKQFRRIPFEADLEAARLCSAPQPPRHAGTKEDPHTGTIPGEPDEEDFPKDVAVLDVGAGESVTLLDAPDGRPLHTFPALGWGFKLIRLRTEGQWDLVAVGDGPYLLGWVPSRRPREEGDKDNMVGGLLLGRTSKVPFALHGAKLKALPLHTVPAGTELQNLGVPRARFKQEGFARVHRTKDEWSFVTAAVDNDVTVHGWVETAKLGPPAEP